MTSSVRYAELTPRAFRERIAAAPIAYLPLGTLEWHGEHLPLGSDAIISEGFFSALAAKVGGIVLPPLFLGPDSCQVVDGKEFYGMDKASFPDGPPQQLDGSAYWVSDELFGNLIAAVLKQLARAGFKIVVAHGHGPSTNFFRAHAAEWEDKFGIKLFICWRAKEEETDGLGIQTDHAGANETSLVMALRPELVEMANLPADLKVWPLGVGRRRDPRIHANANLGKQAIGLQVERMTEILRKCLSPLAK